MIEFPHDFLWGAAISSYQVEGDNVFADWWQWEQKGNVKEKSSSACKHYQLYREDFDLAAKLNHNAHRFSIEWSRIEPQENKFDPQEIQHYKDILIALRERNLEPIVTLYHFTLPLWFVKQGGWLKTDSYRYFLRFVEKIVSVLSPYVRYWVTINEPLVYIYNAYCTGIWPPQQRSFLKAKKVYDNLIRTHLQAYKIIKDIYQKNRLLPPYISIAKHLRQFIVTDRRPFHYLEAFLKDYFFNFHMLNKLVSLKSLDFIGVNYYTSEFLPWANAEIQNLPKSNLGWFVYPQGLYSLLLRLKRYNLAVFILENGISTDVEAERWDFIAAHLESVYRAMHKGVKILGYLYWSLLDNFEWDKGFQPRFGLIAVDYKNYARKIRESAYKFASVCKTGKL